MPFDKISGKGNFIFRIIGHILRKKIKKTDSMFFFALMRKKRGYLCRNFVYLCFKRFDICTCLMVHIIKIKLDYLIR